MSIAIHISATTPTGKVFHIFRHAGGSFCCITIHGSPGDLADAGVFTGKMRCIVLMDACSDPTSALAILKTMGLPDFTYRLLTPVSAIARSPAKGPAGFLATSAARLRALVPLIAAPLYRRNADPDPGPKPLAERVPGSATRLAPALYLRLFHGRSDPAANLDDWGDGGPVIGPLAYVHTTYMCDVKFAAPVDVMERFFPDVIADWRARGISSANGPLCEWQFDILNDLIHHDGVFYGDWSVFSADVPEAA